MADSPAIALAAAQATPRVCGDAAHVLIREELPAGAINLRLDHRDMALQKVQQCLGFTLPLTPRSIAAGSVTVVWQAFDEWLVLTPDGAQDALLERLREALAGHHAALTDVSDLHALFEVAGPLSRDLLAKGCALDLHQRVFQAGHCTLTAFARVRVTLRQLDAAPRYQLLVERSYSHYLWNWLTDAAVEFLGAD